MMRPVLHRSGCIPLLVECLTAAVACRRLFSLHWSVAPAVITLAEAAGAFYPNRRRIIDAAAVQHLRTITAALDIDGGGAGGQTWSVECKQEAFLLQRLLDNDSAGSVVNAVSRAPSDCNQTLSNYLVSSAVKNNDCGGGADASADDYGGSR